MNSGIANAVKCMYATAYWCFRFAKTLILICAHPGFAPCS
jgi:hypothetical protein